jgi:hypothetical protein
VSLEIPYDDANARNPETPADVEGYMAMKSR